VKRATVVRSGIFFAGWVLLSGFLYFFFRYHLYSIEQSQLFICNGENLIAYLSEPGSITLLFSKFIVQFYLYLPIGPVLLGGILTIAGLQMDSIYRKIAPNQVSLIFSLLLVLSLLLLHGNTYYSLQGTFSILFVLLAFRIFLNIKSFKGKYVYILLAIPLLFWITGSGATLFVLMGTGYLLLTSPRYFLWLLIPLAESLLIGWGSVYFGLIGEYRLAFLPDMFYYYLAKPNYLIYIPWLLILLGLGLTTLLSRRNRPGVRRMRIEIAVQSILFIGIAGTSLAGILIKSNYSTHQLEYLAANEDWDGIIKLLEGKQERYSALIYLHIAQAVKGEMAEKLFHHTQAGSKGLIPSWDQSLFSATLSSDFHYLIGNIAGAQRYAFEGNVMNNNTNPRMIKRLVKTYLINGSYAIAERNIRTLEQTYGYRDWAKEYRKFLYNDKAVESDPELGFKRRSLLQNNFLFETASIVYLLTQLVLSNPQNTIALEYLGAGYLLEKNLVGFKNMLDSFFRTPSLPTLPSSFQEAALAAYEEEPDKWRDLNISGETIRQYEIFKKDYTQASENKAMANSIMDKHRNSYWYYLLYK